MDTATPRKGGRVGYVIRQLKLLLLQLLLLLLLLLLLHCNWTSILGTLSGHFVTCCIKASLRTLCCS